jgi:hypothetical protein
VQLHDKSGKVLRKGEGVCIIDSDISCDFDEGRSLQAAAAAAAPAPSPSDSRLALSPYELKNVAAADDDENEHSQPAAASAFVGAGKRIKAASTASSSGAAAATSFGGGAAADSMGQPAQMDRPALSWCLNFHWYDGQQDKVPSNPADAHEAPGRTGSAGSRSSAGSASRTSSASSAASDAPPRTKSSGSTASDASDNPFAGAGNKTKGKKPWIYGLICQFFVMMRSGWCVRDRINNTLARTCFPSISDVYCL